jgi:hypothetical protein
MRSRRLGRRAPSGPVVVAAELHWARKPPVPLAGNDQHGDVVAASAWSANGTCKYLVRPTIFVHIDAVTGTPVLALRGVPAPIVFGAHDAPTLG